MTFMADFDMLALLSLFLLISQTDRSFVMGMRVMSSSFSCSAFLELFPGPRTSRFSSSLLLLTNV